VCAAKRQNIVTFISHLGKSSLRYIQFNVARLWTLPPGTFLVCAILYQILGLHVRLVHTSQDHGLGTITAKPEVFQPLATRLCRQNELINLAITQVVEFPPGLVHWLTITLGLGTALSGVADLPRVQRTREVRKALSHKPRTRSRRAVQGGWCKRISRPIRSILPSQVFATPASRS